MVTDSLTVYLCLLICLTDSISVVRLVQDFDTTTYKSRCWADGVLEAFEVLLNKNVANRWNTWLKIPPKKDLNFFIISTCWNVLCQGETHQSYWPMCTNIQRSFYFVVKCLKQYCAAKKRHHQESRSALQTCSRRRKPLLNNCCSWVRGQHLCGILLGVYRPIKHSYSYTNTSSHTMAQPVAYWQTDWIGVNEAWLTNN